MVVMLLEGEGHQVRAAYDGQHGLTLLRQTYPDLVVLDVEMPKLTGPEMSYRMIVEDSGLELIPILLYSGIDQFAKVAAAVGTPYFLAKPFQIKTLLDMVAKALDERIPPTPELPPG